MTPPPAISAPSVPRWVRLLRIELHPDVAEAAADWVATRYGFGTALVQWPDRRRTVVEAYPSPGRRLPAAARLADELAVHLRRSFGRRFTVRAERLRLPRGAWFDVWKKGLEPIRIGRRLVVRPAWWKGPAERGRVEVLIDPGPAFGTGHHASTRLCLQAIEELAREESPPRTLLDVGCGSGVLAIAAARLGFARVEGIDNDLLAVEEARRNAARNGLEAHRFAFEEADAASWPARRRYDVVACNMVALLMRIAGPLLRRSPRDGGRLVLSGLLRSDHEETVRAIAPRWPIERVRSRGPWCCVTLRKPEPRRR